MIGLDKIPTCPGVYEIRCRKTGDTYIGSSNNMRTRGHSHVSVHYFNSALHRLMGKHGARCFSIRVLRRCKTEAEARVRERLHIATRKPTLNRWYDTQGYKLSIPLTPLSHARLHLICYLRGRTIKDFVLKALTNQLKADKKTVRKRRRRKTAGA